MFVSTDEKLTFSPFFLQPANASHRRYEALRAYFVEGLPSKQAAARFGYSPGSFRGLVHQFRSDPKQLFFRPVPEEARATKSQDQRRQRVVALRKQEGFARLPRRRDEERPGTVRPVAAEAADVRRLDLSPRQFRTKFGGLFLFLPDLAACDLPGILARAGFPR